MKIASKPGMKLDLLKPQSAGGKGGHKFDSGCNLSGVKSVRIECGTYVGKGKIYRSTIERIYLDFRQSQPLSSTSDNDVIYSTRSCRYFFNQSFTFDLDPTDQIFKAVVWSDDDMVNAVQFHTESGIISPMYGIPREDSIATEFQGRQDGVDYRIVGIYGRYGRAIDSLGFTFASIRQHIPDTVVRGSWDAETEEDTISQGSPPAVTQPTANDDPNDNIAALREHLLL